MSENVRSKAMLALGMMLVLGVSAVFRLPALGLRPFHGDEANQAVKTGVLLEEGRYAYDPHEHHGPTLYYAGLASLWLHGAHTFAESSMPMYRLVPALFGVVLVALVWGLRGALGPGAAWWAAAFLAVSHVMVYYSRYYIQEIMLVTFSMGVLVAGWRYYRKPHWFHAAACGVCLGLMHATKETCIVIYAAMAGGLMFAMAMSRFRDGRPLDLRAWWRPGHGLLMLGGAAAVSILFFTSFFTHPRGPLDSILTYMTYFVRAEGEGSTALHDKPWYYYLSLLAHTYRTAGPRWTEAGILGLSLLGVAAAVSPRAQGEEAWRVHFGRFLAAYTVLLTAAFSAIAYKTPWNLLPFYHGMVLLAGLGAAWAIRAVRWRVPRAVVVLALLGVLGHAAYQSYLGNFRYPADVRNPYVYAHTSTAINRLAQRMEQLGNALPEGRELHINVVQPDGDYWPLPWYLRGSERVGYWHTAPEHPDADVIIASPPLGEELAKRLHGEYTVEYHGLRPGVLRLVFIRKELWDAFLETVS